MKVVGIDPGKNGCACLIDSKNNLIKYKKLVFNKANMLDRPQLDNWLREINPNLIVMEKVQGRGGWGATQSFNFGLICGQIMGSVSEYPTVFPPPQTWQAVSCRCIMKGASDAKERTLAAYRTMFPKNPLGLKKTYDKDRLDSFMIALYGQIVFAKIQDFDLKLVEEKEEAE